MKPSQERGHRMEQPAEAERRAGDPTATKPSQARAGFAIMILVLFVAVGLIAAMFVAKAYSSRSVPTKRPRGGASLMVSLHRAI